MNAQPATRAAGTIATSASSAASTRSRRSQSQSDDPEHRRRDAGTRGREQHRDDRRVGERGAAHADRNRATPSLRRRVRARAARRRRARARSSSRSDRAAARRDRRPGRAQGSPCPRAPRGRRRRTPRSAPRPQPRGIGATGAEQQADGEEAGEDERPVRARPTRGRARPTRRPTARSRRPSRGRDRRARRRPPGAAHGRRAPALPSCPQRARTAIAVHTESPAKTAPSSIAVATDTATPGLRIAGQASMVTGKPRRRIRGALQTVYLPLTRASMLSERLCTFPADRGGERPGTTRS